MRIFSYTKLSATYCWKRSWKSYSFEITVCEAHAMKILKTTCGIL